jgi:putative ABC transport system permease protein
MYKHYLSTALRHFRQHKLTTAINVVCLALGLTSFIAAYGAVTYFINGDRQFANVDRIHLIAQRVQNPARGIDTGFRRSGSLAVAKYLRNDVPELPVIASITEVTAMSVFVGGRRQFMDAAAADPDFLRIFDFRFAQAVRANPLLEPREVVLTEDAAIRLFGTTAVLGRSLRLENALDVTVGAVMKSLPRSSHFFKEPGTSHFGWVAELYSFEMLFSRDTYLALQSELQDKPAPSWGAFATEWGYATFTYALLPEGGTLTAAALNERLTGFGKRHGANAAGKNFEYRAIPVAQIRLATLERTVFRNSAGASLVTLVMLIASLVLGVACVNYANLAVAQSLTRSREVGMRRVLGASRIQIVIQQLTVAALQSGLAVLTALALMVAVAAAVDTQAHLDLLGAILSNVRFWGSVAFTSLSVAVLVGLYPAVVLSRVHPAESIRAGKTWSASGAGSRIVVGLQFAVTSALLIGVIVVQAQNTSLRRTALSETADQVVVLRNGWNSAGASIETWRHELLGDPAIKSVSAMAWTPWSEGWGLSSLIPRADATEVVGAISTPVYYDFQDALRMQLLAGRTFDRAFMEPSDDVGTVAAGTSGTNWRSQGVVIDRALAEQLGFNTPQAAVDRIIYQPSSAQASPQPVKIIGVVENKPLRVLPVFGHTGNMYRLQPDGDPNMMSYIVVRIASHAIPATLEFIDGAWQRLSDAPINRKFMDEYFQQTYQIYARAGAILTTLSCIAFVIAAMGLFGMAVFVAGQRIHEIGVRKTLGARTGQIVVMLLRDFSTPVLFANILIWPLAYVAMQAYLNNFIQRIDLSPLPFVLSLAVTLLIAWIAVGGQAVRAARARPSTVLRYE